MKIPFRVPYFFDELPDDQIDLLDSYIEGNLMVELRDYLECLLSEHENRSFFDIYEYRLLLEVFHLNLTLEGMRRKGIVAISRRIYILDKNIVDCEISIGSQFKR